MEMEKADMCVFSRQLLWIPQRMFYEFLSRNGVSFEMQSHLALFLINPIVYCKKFPLTDRQLNSQSFLQLQYPVLSNIVNYSFHFRQIPKIVRKYSVHYE